MLTNIPQQETPLRLATGFHYAFRVAMKLADKEPIDVTDCTLQLVIREKPRFGGTTVATFDGEILGGVEEGFFGFLLQPEDTETLTRKSYDYSLVFTSDSLYSVPVVVGSLETSPVPLPSSALDDALGAPAADQLNVTLRGDTVTVKVQHLMQPRLEIGSVTTLEPGEDAGASISGHYPHQLLHLSIPSGGGAGGDGPSFGIDTDGTYYVLDTTSGIGTDTDGTYYIE